VNSFQRRLAFIAFAAILLKASLPDVTWAQVVMFGDLAWRHGSCGQQSSARAWSDC
jgi:hypothetical protein